MTDWYDAKPRFKQKPFVEVPAEYSQTEQPRPLRYKFAEAVEVENLISRVTKTVIPASLAKQTAQKVSLTSGRKAEGDDDEDKEPADY